MKYKHLFGPVPSRRLGSSLGVDLIPFKTCSLDCVYCECGKTTRLTTTRKEYIPTSAVKAELDHYLAAGPALDYITFAGSGEPTLNREIGSVIAHIKKNYPHYKICLLTNGTLFSIPAVRSAVSQLDLIIPSLDAAREKTFQAVNRPHETLRCETMIEGLINLRREFRGEMIMEVFIVPGLNDCEEDLHALKKALENIKPDRIQLGTLDRPGTEEWVEEASEEKMLEIARYLGSAEIIGELRERQKISSFNQSYSRQIMQTLRRRPCTAKDLEEILDLRPAELQKYLNDLLENKKITSENKERGVFFKIKKSPGGSG
jgi:wyosine [tRNA(Phe)-imidazoG37] synthetase (radical SAM superfamily)